MTQAMRAKITAPTTSAANTQYSQPHDSIEPFPDRAQLHADQHEGQHVEHEHRGVPHRIGGHAQARRRVAPARVRAIVMAIDDDGEDAGEADPLGEDPDR